MRAKRAANARDQSVALVKVIVSMLLVLVLSVLTIVKMDLWLFLAAILSYISFLLAIVDEGMTKYENDKERGGE